jgi:RNA polymerase sigma factor (sigma-70 family)
MAVEASMDMTEVQLKSLSVKLRRFFEWNRCPSAEDLAQETILRGLKKFAGGAINYGENPHSYFMGIARYILREQRKRPRGQVALDDTSGELPAHANSVHWRILLRECLERLSPEDRSLIVIYILDGPENAARAYGLSQNAVRIRVSRIRARIATRLRASFESDPIGAE